MQASSLYIHFPFCETKCHYCDFYSLGREKTREQDPTLFERALLQEARAKAHLLAPELDTIFMGGGTPSMTSPSSMARSLAPLWHSTKITEKTEWTLEANPSSVSKSSLKEYRQLGINRISMGVQALQPHLLTRLGRVHSREEAILALQTIFEVGFDNVSVDLLCGVPGQSLLDLKEALSILMQFPITHLSCYLLTLPKHHAMYPELPNEEIQLSHLLFIHEWLGKNGFEHYEISNFAKPEMHAQHNLRYWKGASYLGLGPSAHSYDKNSSQRWKNVSSLHRYVSLLNQGESVIDGSEILTTQQLHLEKWMLALRLEEGFPASWLETPHQKAATLRLQEEGLLENHPIFPERNRLTARGFALSDQIIAMLS